MKNTKIIKKQSAKKHQSKNSHKKWVVLGVGLAVTGLLGLLVSQLFKKTETTDLTATRTVKIGLIGPLSGANVQIGTSAKRGIELAIREINIEGLKIELVTKDTDCSAAKSAGALNELITKEKVVAVVGDFCSGATLAAAPVANKLSIPLISPASSSPDVTQAGDFVFRTIPSDALQSSFLAQLMANNNRKRIGIIHGNEAYGIGLQKAVTDQLKQRGITVVATESIEAESIDFSSQLSRIKAASPDALVIMMNSYASNVAALIGAKEVGLNVPLFGSEAMKSQTILIDAAEVAEGLTVSAVSSGDAQFRDKFKAIYQIEPGDYSAQAYDAARSLGMAIDKESLSGTAIKDNLYKVEFMGATGAIKFDANGDVAGNYLGFQVKNGEFESIN